VFVDLSQQAKAKDRHRRVNPRAVEGGEEGDVVSLSRLLATPEPLEETLKRERETSIRFSLTLSRVSLDHFLGLPKVSPLSPLGAHAREVSSMLSLSISLSISLSLSLSLALPSVEKYTFPLVSPSLPLSFPHLSPEVSLLWPLPLSPSLSHLELLREAKFYIYLSHRSQPHSRLLPPECERGRDTPSPWSLPMSLLSPGALE